VHSRLIGVFHVEGRRRIEQKPASSCKSVGDDCQPEHPSPMLRGVKLKGVSNRSAESANRDVADIEDTNSEKTIFHWHELA
jgi:hypothetical protein